MENKFTSFIKKEVLPLKAGESVYVKKGDLYDYIENLFPTRLSTHESNKGTEDYLLQSNFITPRSWHYIEILDKHEPLFTYEFIQSENNFKLTKV